MKFSDIKKFPRSSYIVNINWAYLQKYIEGVEIDYDADFDPDFQRGHVWTEQQQIDYCEYILKGGTSGKDIYCNCPNWEGGGDEGEYVLVDGKQRLTAVLRFLKNEIKAFGTYLKDFKGPMRSMGVYFNWHVASISDRTELLQWYVDFNSGGTDHAPEELDRVRRMIIDEQEKK